MSILKRPRMSTDDSSDGNTSCDSRNSKKNAEAWREAHKNYKDRNKYALKEGILSDVTFAVGPEKMLFHCHKTILSLASPVFEAMFFGSLKETNQVITIPDLMPAGFQLLLDHIYSDDMKLKNESDAFAAWIAGDKYCLPFMKDACFKFLYDLTITENNVWIILENSLFLNSEPLEDKCWNYLKKNVATALEHSSFFDVSQDVIKKLLMRENLCIEEISLTLHVVKWVQEQIKNGSEGSLKELLQPFLGYIRFGSMAQVEFVRFIDEHKGIISDSDAVSIFKYMTDDTFYSLPEWCCKNVNSRKVFSKRPFSKQSIAAYALKPKRCNRGTRKDIPDTERDPCNYHHPDGPVYHGYHSSVRAEARMQYLTTSSENSTDSDDNQIMTPDSEVSPYSDSESTTSSSSDSD